MHIFKELWWWLAIVSTILSTIVTSMYTKTLHTSYWIYYIICIDIYIYIYIIHYWTYKNIRVVHTGTYFNPSTPCSVRCPALSSAGRLRRLPKLHAVSRRKVWLQLVMFCKNNPNIKDDKLGNPMKNMNMIFGAPEFVPACFFGLNIGEILWWTNHFSSWCLTVIIIF